MSTGTVILFATQPSSFAISTSWCGYCYWCHAHSQGLFVFWDLVYHYWLVDPGPVLCVGLILPCRSFKPLPCCCIDWLSTYLVRWLPCIWITALLRLICVIKVVQCLLFFPCWPARYRVWQTNTVLLLFQHTFPPFSMWRPIICPGVRCSQGGIFSLRWLKQLFTFGVYKRWTCWHPPVPLNPSIITTWNLHYLWGSWGWMPSNHPWTLQVSYVFPPPALVPLVLSKFLAQVVKGELRHLILVAPCWMEAPWFPTVLNMLADILWQCPHHKRSCHGCFGRPGAQGSAVSAFNPLAAQQCVLCRQGLSSSFCQVVVGATWVSTSKVYKQCWKEWAGWCAQQVYQKCDICPKLADFFGAFI